jgi:superoxide dismutase, Cu-Zn family
MTSQSISIRKNWILPALLGALVMSGTGCDPRTGGGNQTHQGHDHPPMHETPERRVRQALAQLEPTEGNTAQGTVTFTRAETGIRVNVSLTGLGQPGPRGFHIHEKGDCSAPDAMSAGGHFNPTDMPHAGRHDEQRHVGDFGNLTVGEDGTAEYEFIDTHISFDGIASIIGRSVIVHAEEDDLETQPTGDSGARVACGVIQVTEFFE